jgi:hypothetical protein
VRETRDKVLLPRKERRRRKREIRKRREQNKGEAKQSVNNAHYPESHSLIQKRLPPSSSHSEATRVVPVSIFICSPPRAKRKITMRVFEKQRTWKNFRKSMRIKRFLTMKSPLLRL